MEPWGTLDSKVVYAGKRIDLLEDSVRMPDGTDLIYPYLHKIPAVTILAIDEEGNVPMVRQFRYPVKKVQFELPAGHMEPGESPEECGRRELEEETGWRAMYVQLVHTYNPTNEVSDQVFHVVLATGLREGRKGGFEGTFIESELLHKDELIKMIEKNEMEDGRTIIAVLLAKQKGLL